MIFYTKPSITSLESKYVMDAIDNGWGENCYDYIEKFEKNFSDVIGRKYAIATSSCTGALTLGISSIKWKPNDEVIMADTNWVATISPFIHAGIKVVLADIDPETWCISTDSLKRKITKNTKAVVLTHIYGNVSNIDEIEEICKDNNIFLIEDAAEAIGGSWGENQAGSFGLFSTFSFHGTKTITCGEGGMILTDDKEFYENVACLNNHGRRIGETRQFYSQEIGFKFKMSNVQAALGCAQIERIEELTKRKYEIYKTYLNYLDLNKLKTNPISKHGRNAYWMINVVFPRELNFKKISNEFKKIKADVRPFFWPLSWLPPYKYLDSEDLIESKEIFKRSLNLPTFHDITESQIKAVCNVINSFEK